MPLAISGIAFLIFTGLLWLGRIGEASYCFLVAASALLGLVLHGFARLQELDLKNLRLVLREIDQTKKELFVREEQLKAIAIPLAQIIALTGASEGRMGSKESWAIKREWYRQRIQALVNALQLSSQTQQKLRSTQISTLKLIEYLVNERLSRRRTLTTPKSRQNLRRCRPSYSP